MPTDARDSLLMSRASVGSNIFSSCISCWLAATGDVVSLSGAEEGGAGEASWAVGRLELGGGGLVVYEALAASDAGITCIPPYCKAAISCGERGRDLRLSFWRRF